MANYSRQREAILNYLCSTTEHPSAFTVYETVKKQIPNISLGTVYRNLGNLEEDGKIIKIAINQAEDRFDAKVSPHAHICCKKCGRVMDIDLEHKLETLIMKNCEEAVGFSLIYYGTCKNCK